MYSKTATNFWLDCSCLLAWIFWFISWNTQIFLQFQLKMWVNQWCLCRPFAKSLIVPTWSKWHFHWWTLSCSPSPGEQARESQEGPVQSLLPRSSWSWHTHPAPMEVTSFLAAKTTSTSSLKNAYEEKAFCCLNAPDCTKCQASGEADSPKHRVRFSILHLPPFCLN